MMNTRQEVWLMGWKKICLLVLSILATAAAGAFVVVPDAAQAKNAALVPPRTQTPSVLSPIAARAVNFPSEGVAQQSPLDLLALTDL
ncbi:MAG: hypothetical protein NZ553_11500, partial [Caldilinea sp.]|nr:hypothetical protein [Caldilinea sp.]MDW8441090.1 hypothetical protein [Caldilineaceae bacterium]